MDADSGLKKRSDLQEGEINDVQTDADFLQQFTIDGNDSFITTDAGGPIQDNISLKAGERGPTLLEDFIFRQKIQHFDHERVDLSPLISILRFSC
jgi:catalase